MSSPEYYIKKGYYLPPTLVFNNNIRLFMVIVILL